MKLQKTFSLLLGLFLFTGTLTACGTSSAENTSTAENISSQSSDDAETQKNAEDADTDTSTETVKLIGLADLTPHSELIEFVKPKLEEQGIEVELVGTAWDATWSEKVQNGEVDFHYAAHWPAQEAENETNDYTLVNAGDIHIEPITAYSNKWNTVEEVPDNAKVIIPNDSTNEYRALKILEEAGFIKIREDLETQLRASVLDIEEYIKPIEIVEMDSIQIIGHADEFDIYITNTNKAIEAGVDTSKYLFRESEDSPYANIIVTTPEKAESPEIKALVEALQSKETAEYILEHYNGAVIPVYPNGNGGDAETISDDTASAEKTDIQITEPVTLKGLADLTPHSEIIEFVKPELEEKGITIDIVSTASDATWNSKLQNGEVDFNFMQHEPYLIEWDELNDGNLVNAGNIHVEPIAAYSERYSDVSEVPDDATVVIPDDATNEYRALRILEEAGFIKLGQTENARASVLDIEEYLKPIKITELDSYQINTHINEFDIYINNTNKVIEAGLDASNYLFREGEESPYANIIAVTPENLDNPAIQALVEALQSKETAEFIIEKYNGAVIPVTSVD